MPLSKKILSLVKQAPVIEKHTTDGALGKPISYYTVDCPTVHVAVWPHWVVVSGNEVTKRFYPLYNPVYKYLHSYEWDLDKFKKWEAKQHAGINR